jgi:hypothetical protein
VSKPATKWNFLTDKIARRPTPEQLFSTATKVNQE